MGSSGAVDAESRKSARVDDRMILNAIFYVLRTGMPWRDLPERYGPIQRRTIASTVGLGAASGSGFSTRWHRNRATAYI